MKIYINDVKPLEVLLQRGSPNSGWSVKNTADLLGYTQGAISQNLIIAETLHAFPELSHCDTAVEIRQAVKGMQKRFREKRLSSLIENQGVSLDISNIFHLGNFIPWMYSLKTNSVDILITDPPMV